MKGMQFDRVTRSLTDLSSRRTFLGGLAGVSLGLAAVGSPHVTEARKKRRKSCKKRCNPCEKCAGGKCTPKAIGSSCAKGGICLVNGFCARECTATAECGSGCSCGGNVEGGAMCIVNPLLSCDPLQVCTSTAECPPGHQCEAITCNGVPSVRCVPLCSA